MKDNIFQDTVRKELLACIQAVIHVDTDECKYGIDVAILEHCAGLVWSFNMILPVLDIHNKSILLNLNDQYHSLRERYTDNMLSFYAMKL